ncbi:hypothetical protein OE88DRAFT_1642987 [Heliocybe sulcata]|uniref:RanBD1 domain-containing protein n=1 Tax=Heliocybe sulcata TaxID=5364 RepID=A0A5C3NB23_9AGAM|nr:hypothetical protein OE88DRAFT_1642987 [Heliocybe sulcata]
MKRGAEKQLRREEAEDDYDGEPERSQEIPRGFVKAEESELSRRKMRALPKRMGGVAPVPAAPTPALAPAIPEPATTNGAASNAHPVLRQPSTRFGGFSGFGTGGSTPFSFAAPVPSTNTAKPAAAPKFSAFPTPSSAPPSSSPPVSSTASAATKSFAAFLVTASSSTTPNSGSSPPAANGTDDSAALKYYTSLRGLNVSFMKAITKAVEEDPFVDVASLMESYNSLRIAVQSEFEKAPKASTSKGGADSKPHKPTSMPAPPTGFAGFGSLTSSMTAPSTSSGGFTPKVDSGSSSTKSSGFSFPISATPSSTDKPPSGFSFPAAPPTSSSAGTSSAPSKLPFSLTPSAPPTSDSKSEDSPEPASPFTFGSSAATKSDAAPAAFSFAPSSGDKKTPPSSFSGSTFNFGNAKNADKDKDKDKSLPAANLFGGSSTFGTSTPVKSEKQPPSGGFSFGTGSGTSTPTSSTFAGFGKPSGSIGNPVGFGFGSPPRTVSGSDSGPKLTFPSSSFGFGQPKGEEGKGNTENEGKEGQEKPAVAGSEDQDTARTESNSIHDQEGQGEEDEETMHSVKTKVFRFMKNPENEMGKWVDLGVGILKLKKHKETDSRRMLLRNTSTGRVVINFKIYASMTPKVSSKIISFTGHEEGNAVMYQLRVKTAEDAEQLNQALTREIEFVKGQWE